MTLEGHRLDILGQGWEFPVRLTKKGGIAFSKHEDDIRRSILLILGTIKGERGMRPEFGTAINEYVFAPNNATTAGLIAYEVREALERWEPRIDVTFVDVNPDPLEPACALIDINYVISATNHEKNLVYPFYLIPTEEYSNGVARHIQS